MKSKRRMPAESRSSSDNTGSQEDSCRCVQEEIWRIVGEAARNGTSISTALAAREIEGAFPKSGLTTRNIADALVYAAVDAGVMLERKPPLPRQVLVERLPRFSFGALRGGGVRGRAALAAPAAPAPVVLEAGHLT